MWTQFGPNLHDPIPHDWLWAFFLNHYSMMGLKGRENNRQFSKKRSLVAKVQFGAELVQI